MSYDYKFTSLLLLYPSTMCNPPSERSSAIVWHPDDPAQPTPSQPNSTELYRPDILETIEANVHEMDAELRALSLDIHCMTSADDLGLLI